MFVKILNPCNNVLTDVVLPAIGEVSSFYGTTKILTLFGKEYSSKHPAEEVRKALTLFAQLLSGREEMQIPFPLSNVVPGPQSITGLCLDLTKEKIEITEESAP